MDTPAVIEAVAITAIVAPIVQERFLSKWEGKRAIALSVLLSLGIGTVAVARTGGLIIVGDPSDPFAIAASVMASAGTIIAASQVAFRVFVKPVAK